MVRLDDKVLRELEGIAANSVVMEWLRASVDEEIKVVLQNPPDVQVKIGRAKFAQELVDRIQSAGESLERVRRM